MPLSLSSTTADRSFSTVRGAPSLPDPADIFRRLDRRPPPRPLWMTAVAIAVLAVVAAGGAIAFQDELSPLAPHTLLVAPSGVSHA